MSLTIGTFRSMIVGISLWFAGIAMAGPVVVKTYGQHVGGNIVYAHEVSNTGSAKIVTLYIANDTDYISLNQPATRDIGELRVLPLGSNYRTREIVPGSVSGPSGWTAEILQIEHNWQCIVWRRPPYPEPAIEPGQTATFRVTVPTHDEAYLTGHFSARLVGASTVEAYNGVMEKLDTTPPALTLTVSPARLQTLPGRLVAVKATITVTDDYDPAPEIKLESITANEPLAANDISGATLGTDDRQFRLRDVRVPQGTGGRVYTITYSATDASGNKTTASATVRVK